MVVISKKGKIIFFAIFGIIGLSLLFVNFFLISKNRTSNEIPIRILTYSSFVNPWGPGYRLAEQFEETTGQKIEFIDAGDAAILFQRAKLEIENNSLDLILGYDQLMISSLPEEILFKEFDLKSFDLVDELRQLQTNTKHIPYDWAPMGFVFHSESKNKPSKIEDLLTDSFKKQFSLQDPRTSTPGLQFLFWILYTYGEEEGFSFLKKIIQQAHSISSSWSGSYGLFQSKVVPLTFSYLTSPVYHWIEKQDDSVEGLNFSIKHPFQVEFCALLNSCRSCEGAKQFLEYLLSFEAQQMIMKSNYMLPVIKGVIDGSEFEKIAQPDLIDYSDYLKFLKNKQRVLKQWLKILRK